MELNTLVRSTGLKDPMKQIWRWNWNGKWNYSTKGLKWQKARSGGKVPHRFEWWQTPLAQRLPKLKWFKRYFKLVKNITPLNLSDINSLWLKVINKDILLEKNIIPSIDSIVKILWTWEITSAVKFEGINNFSKSAKEKIEKAGWEII